MKPLLLFTFMLVCSQLFSCGKVVEPGLSDGRAFEYPVTVTAMLVRGAQRDSVTVSFAVDSSRWDNSSLSHQYMILIKKHRGNSMAEIVRKQLLASDISHLFVNYNDTPSSVFLDSVIVSNDTVFTMVTDSGFADSIYYSAVAIVGVEWDTISQKLNGGFSGIVSNSNKIVTGAGVGLTLFDGRLETSINPVPYSAVVPLNGVTRIIAHKYSALQPVNDIAALVALSKAKNDTGASYSGRILNGFFAKPETLSVSNRSQFTKYDTVGGNGLQIGGLISLAMGYGRKYLVFECQNNSGQRVGQLLWDDIRLKMAKAAVVFDFDRANRDSFFVNSISNKLCVLSGVIPIIFDTYGDTSFIPEIDIWIATRKMSSSLFASGTMSGGTLTDKANNAVPWGDCIMETVPERFIIPSSGRLRESILGGFNYYTGYRVSPLASVSKQASGGWSASDFGGVSSISTSGIRRSDSSMAILSRLIETGSILGHKQAALNTFDSSLISAVNPDSSQISVPSWFDMIPLSDIKTNYSTIRAYLQAAIPGYRVSASGREYSVSQAYSLDNDYNLYQHPFRGIPVTSSHVTEGTKEFVIIVVAKGRFFGEKRVYYSSSTSSYSLVWDAIPPQIKWVTESGKDNIPIYLPSQATAYAPMCYTNTSTPSASKCTDFSVFRSGVFDVSLSIQSSRSKSCAVRDAGFGFIRSVSLNFNYSAEYLGSDPLTGERRYVTPSIVVSLPVNEIVKQQWSVYYALGKIAGASYSLTDVAFRNIDFTGWRSGRWDMWIETEDSFGNRGLAPYAGSIAVDLGETSVRTLEIK